MIMYALRLGIVTSLFSEIFVNAFTCGCACSVVLSLLGDILGIKIPPVPEYFQSIFVRSKKQCNATLIQPMTFFQTLLCIFLELGQVNVVVLGVSIVSGVLMILNNEFLKVHNHFLRDDRLIGLILPRMRKYFENSDE